MTFTHTIYRNLILFLGILFVSLPFFSFSNHIETKNKNLQTELDKAHGTKWVDLINNIAQLNKGNYDSVFYYTEIAINKSRELEYDQGIADAFFERGKILHLIGKNEKAYICYEKALEIYIKLKNYQNSSRCLNSIGLNYMVISDYDAALNAFKTVLLYADSIEIANSYLNIGTLLENAGNDQKALEYCRESIKIFEKYKSESGIAGNHLVIARILSHQKEYTRALEYVNNAKEIFININDKSNYANSINELALIYTKIDKKEKAINAYKEALGLLKDANSKEGIASVSFNLSLEYLHSGNLLKAKQYYSTAHSASEDMKDKYLKCDVLWLASEIKHLEGDESESIRLLNESLSLAIDLSSWHNIANISRKLSLYFNENEDFQKAFEYTETYIEAKDTLISIEMAIELSRLKFTNDFSTMENELALQETKIQLLEKKKENARLISYLIIIISVMLFIFTLFSISRQKRISKYQKDALENEKAVIKLNLEKEVLNQIALNKIISYKNKQLTNFAIHLTEKNSLLERFKSNIKSAKKSVQGKKITGVLQDMLVSISQDIDINKERLEFYKEIEDLNQTFINNLRSKFPELTERELKLCALLRVNLSTKRIAVLLELSPTSIDIYRHNLRKKLKIEKGISLNKYFSEL